LILNDWWPYVFDINRFTNACPHPDIVFPPEDVSAPAAPTGAMSMALGSSRIGLSWNEPPDDVGVTRYEIFRDGVLLRKTSVTYLIDDRLSANTQYTYAIKACDGSDNASAAATVVTTTQSPDSAGTLLNGSFEFLPQISGWTTDAFSSSAALFTWEPAGSGRNGGRCISIDASSLNDASWLQTVNGLQAGKTYWVTGWIRGQEVVREPGRTTGANLCLEGTWSHAPDYLDGTFDWRRASFSFVAPPSGTVTIGCRLGYWSNTTRGKVWFDDLAIVDPSELRFDHISMASDTWLLLALFTPPGNHYRIEKSSDLSNWTKVQSFTASHPITEIQDALTPGHAYFYRAVQVTFLGGQM
jgi:hypothetical protein